MGSRLQIADMQNAGRRVLRGRESRVGSFEEEGPWSRGGCFVLLLYIVGIDNNAVIDIAFETGGERGVGKRGID